MKRLVTFLALSAFFTMSKSDANDRYPNAYDATYEMTKSYTAAAGSKTIIHEMSDGKGHVRKESTESFPNGQTERSSTDIYDYSDNMMTRLMDDQKMYITMPIPSGFELLAHTIDEEHLKNFRPNAKSLGTRVIDGHPCRGYELSVDDNVASTVQLWIADDIHCMVQSETTLPNGKELLALKSFSHKAPANDLSAVPSGYKNYNDYNAGMQKQASAVQAAMKQSAERQQKQQQKCRTVESTDLADLTKRSNSRGLKLIAASVDSAGSKNVLVAPAAGTALHLLLLAGLQGDARASLSNSLGIRDIASIDNQSADYFKSLSSTEPISEPGAAIVAGPDISFKPDYIKLVREQLGALAVDTSPAGMQQLQAFVARATHDRIQANVAPPPPMSLLLLSAAYFKGTWADKFQVERTTTDDFHLLNGSTRKVSMMNKWFQFPLLYLRGPNFEAVRLPYMEGANSMIDPSGKAARHGRYSMYIFVPNPGVRFPDFVKAISQKSIESYGSEWTQKSGNLALPRFKIHTKIDIPLPETAEGKPLALKAADLSTMCTAHGEIPLISTTQELDLAVNENGTEAAALTACTMILGIEPDMFNIKADRPFIFVLGDDHTGNILFAGALVDPEDSKLSFEEAEKFWLDQVSKATEQATRLGQYQQVVQQATQVIDDKAKIPPGMPEQFYLDAIKNALVTQSEPLLTDTDPEHKRLLSPLSDTIQSLHNHDQISKAELQAACHKIADELTTLADSKLMADQKALPEDNSHKFARMMLLQRVASYYRTENKLDKSEHMLREALKLCGNPEQEPGKNVLDLTGDLGNTGGCGVLDDLAQLLVAQKRYQEADALYRQLLPKQKGEAKYSLFEARSRAYMLYLEHYADLLKLMNRDPSEPNAEQERLLKHEIDSGLSFYPRERWTAKDIPSELVSLGYKQLALATFYERIGRNDDANKFFKTCLDTLSSSPSPDYNCLYSAASHYLDFLKSHGRAAEADAIAKQVSDWKEKSKAQEIERHKQYEKTKIEAEKRQQQQPFGEYTDEAFQAQLNQFVQAMPASIRDFIGPFHLDKSAFGMSFSLEYMSDKYRLLPPADRLSPVIAALSKSMSGKDQQILELLRWSGAGPASSAAKFLDFANELLLRYEPDEVTKVIKTGKLSHTQWVGSSRYFSAYNFMRRFPQGYAGLDEALKKRIRAELSKDDKDQVVLKQWDDAVNDWAPWTKFNMPHRPTTQ